MNKCIWTRRYCHDFVSSCRPGWLTPHLDGCRHKEDVDDAITKINFCKNCGNEITFETVEYDKEREKYEGLEGVDRGLDGIGYQKFSSRESRHIGGGSQRAWWSR